MDSEIPKMPAVNQETVKRFYETDPITGMTFGMKTLLSDPQTGMSVHCCVYAKSCRKPAHHHAFTFGPSLYMRDGVMRADGRLFLPGEFVRILPARSVPRRGGRGRHNVSDLCRRREQAVLRLISALPSHLFQIY